MFGAPQKRVFAGIALACFLGQLSAAAAPEDRKPHEARGSLTVSATVISSAQLIIDRDGKQHLRVVNAPELPLQIAPQKLDVPGAHASGLKASSPGLVRQRKR